MLIGRSCCKPLTHRNVSECLTVACGKTWMLCYFCPPALSPFIYWTFWLNTLSLSLTDESVIFTKFSRIYKNTACMIVRDDLNGIRRGEHTKRSILRCRKTKLYLNPMWPLFATNIAQYEKKSHHWASCHINYTHGPIIHENAFWWFQKCCLCQVMKQQMQKRHL